MRRSIVITKAATPAAVDNGAPELAGVSAALSAGSVGVSGAAWNLPATISVQQDGTVGLRQYALNAGAHTISVSGLPTGVTYNAGLEQLEGASTGTASATVTFTLTLGAITVVDTATVSLTDAGAITASLNARYVDASGVRQSVSVQDQVTVISGVAPLLVQFDASGSRSTATGNDTDTGAFYGMGFRFNFGEGRGTTWAHDGASMDEEVGPPIAAYVYETPGTHTLRLKIRDADLNERTVQCQVQVAAAPSATHIPVSAGAWPTFTSGSRYTLDAGADYAAAGFGELRFTGLHNVILEKVGAGADPVVSSVRFDNTNELNAPHTRARHIRLVGIDSQNMSVSTVGFDFCGFINGRLRRYTPQLIAGYLWSEIFAQGRTEQQANNVRYVRGFFLWNCDELLESSSNPYVMIQNISGMHIIGTNTNKDTTAQGPGTSGEHNIRGVYDTSTFRHCRIRNTVTAASYIKIQGQDSARSNTPSPWPENDVVGIYAEGVSGLLPVPTSKCVFQGVEFGGADGAVPTSCLGYGPENNVDEGDQGVELATFEDCTFYGPTTATTGFNIELRGRGLGARNIKMNSGDGPEAGKSASTSGPMVTRVPPGWIGPYFTEETNPRPVPSAF